MFTFIHQLPVLSFFIMLHLILVSLHVDIRTYIVRVLKPPGPNNYNVPYRKSQSCCKSIYNVSVHNVHNLITLLHIQHVESTGNLLEECPYIFHALSSSALRPQYCLGFVQRHTLQEWDEFNHSGLKPWHRLIEY